MQSSLFEPIIIPSILLPSLSSSNSPSSTVINCFKYLIKNSDKQWTKQILLTAYRAFSVYFSFVTKSLKSKKEKNFFHKTLINGIFFSFKWMRKFLLFLCFLFFWIGKKFPFCRCSKWEKSQTLLPLCCDLYKGLELLSCFACCQQIFIFSRKKKFDSNCDLR